MDFTITEEQFLNADEKAAKAAQKYAEHVFTLKEVESLKKDFLSALMMQIRADNPGKKMSQSELEMIARSGEEWRTFNVVQIEKLRAAGFAQIQYENAKRRWQTLQSIISLKKSEVKRFGS